MTTLKQRIAGWIIRRLSVNPDFFWQARLSKCCQWPGPGSGRGGAFLGGCIDRDQDRLYSLYMEAWK
jgi:hypothetical protein